MRRDTLIAALTQHRELEVVVTIDGSRLPILGVRYAEQDPDRHTANDQLEIQADHQQMWQIAARYEPGDDDEMMPQMVIMLRELWDDYRQSTRSSSGHAPDFYTWASIMLRQMYGYGFLTVALPADVDPDGPCKCARTSAVHKPRQHASCVYRREITP